MWSGRGSGRSWSRLPWGSWCGRSCVAVGGVLDVVGESGRMSEVFRGWQFASIPELPSPKLSEQLAVVARYAARRFPATYGPSMEDVSRWSMEDVSRWMDRETVAEERAVRLYGRGALSAGMGV